MFRKLKQENKNVFRVIIFIVMTAFVFLASLCSIGIVKFIGWVVTDYSVSVPKTVEEQKTMAALGDPVIFGSFYEVTITRAHVSKRTVGIEGKTYLYLDLRIRNCSAGTTIDTNTFLDDVLLYDYNNNEYDRVASPLIKKDFTNLQLEQGESATGQLAFEINQEFTSYVLTYSLNKYIDKKQILIERAAIDSIQNDNEYFKPGEPVPYGDFEVVMKSVRKASSEESTVLIMTFTLKNTSENDISSDVFIAGADISTIEGLIFDKADPAVIQETLTKRNIAPGKMIQGEIALKIGDTDEDYLFFANLAGIKSKCEILIKADQIAK